MCDVELDIGREFVKNGIICIDIARSSNGRTTVSGTVNPSSNLGLAISLYEYIILSLIVLNFDKFLFICKTIF